MSAPTDLRLLAENILERVEATFAAADIELPERRYVAVGGTAHDCEQVTVSFQQIYLGLPGDQAQAPLKCDSPRSAVFLVEVVREVPSPGRTGKPSVEALYKAGLQQLDDASTLLDAGQTYTSAFAGVIADVSPGEPGGSMQAVFMNIILAVQ